MSNLNIMAHNSNKNHIFLHETISMLWIPPLLLIWVLSQKNSINGFVNFVFIYSIQTVFNSQMQVCNTFMKITCHNVTWYLDSNKWMRRTFLAFRLHHTFPLIGLISLIHCHVVYVAGKYYELLLPNTIWTCLQFYISQRKSFWVSNIMTGKYIEYSLAFPWPKFWFLQCKLTLHKFPFINTVMVMTVVPLHRMIKQGVKGGTSTI